jgi:FkbM family methyltransferase
MDKHKEYEFSRILSMLLAFYGYYLPYHPGKWRIVQKIIKLGKLSKCEYSNFVVKRNDIYYELDTTDAIDRVIYYNGVYEGLITHFMHCIVRPSFYFFDIGANVGYYAMLISRLTGRSAAVYAFEPCPDEFKKLQRNLSLNDFRSVRTYQIALSDTTGNIGLTKKKKGGLTRLSSSSEEAFHDVSCTTLDDFILYNQIPRLNLLKVDIEGSEVNFLRGALQSISQFRPIIIIELNPNALKVFGNNVLEIVQILSKFEYIFYEPQRGGVRLLNQMPKEGNYMNAIALPAKLAHSKRKFSWAELESGLFPL